MFGSDTNLRAIVIPFARIDNASAATGSMVVSAPSPTALLGLMRKIEIDLQAAGILQEGDRFLKVAMAVHDFHLSSGHRRIPPELVGEQNKKAGAIIDDPEACMTCTVVMTARIRDVEVMERVGQFLESRVRGYRLGGGRIVRSGIASKSAGVSAKPFMKPVLVAADEEQFQRIVRILPVGYVLVDCTYILDSPEAVDVSDSNADALDRLLDRLAWIKKPKASPAKRQSPTSANVASGNLVVDTGNDALASASDLRFNAEPMVESQYTWAKRCKQWFSPVNIGWRALSDVSNRAGMRSGTGVLGHVWVEDVLGLGEWISLKRCFGSRRGPDGCAWRYVDAPKEGPFIAIGCDLSSVD